MATDDDQRETDEAAARKRAAPTIDLDPSDVTDTTPGAEEKIQADKPRTGWRARFGGARSSKDKSEPGEAAPPATIVPSRIILAAAFSAAVVALLVSGLWNVLSPNNSDPDIPPAQTSTIEELNTRVTRLEDKPAASADVGALMKRLDALDGSLAAIRKDVTALREQVQDASAKIVTLEKAAASATSAGKAAPAPDMSGIEGRLSKLEQQVVSTEAAKPVAPPPDDTAMRRALAASALDQAVQQGLPYATALATAARFGEGAADTLKPLEAFAATGVPGADALSRELLSQLPRLEAKRENAPAASGWLDRLRNSATHLVRVTRIDDAGSDRTALLSRAKTAAERGDLREAEKTVAQLPEHDRSALQGWIDKVHARAAALAASRAFNQAATAALPSSSH
ncbi:hypothetical protein AFIC_000250 [[Pseudomonas] carboxydohydrogena]|uniref:Mitochondrial inner membrane protein n=1 Tax=Afipia carboxydohydrogena TaxID=290 RepID=A0ABY8BP81_AFICR|nr:hypothetical protein [[Pseudomonas] carboxydohydrogena]WEF51802.1 hypothetical protein AFIC_000250 [[Pseudomonas] carboxydohydrogena]